MKGKVLLLWLKCFLFELCSQNLCCNHEFAPYLIPLVFYYAVQTAFGFQKWFKILIAGWQTFWVVYLCKYFLISHQNSNKIKNNSVLCLLFTHIYCVKCSKHKKTTHRICPFPPEWFTKSKSIPLTHMKVICQIPWSQSFKMSELGQRGNLGQL